MKPFSYKHLGFTGSKDKVTDAQKNTLEVAFHSLRDKGFLWMHNGDCIVGDAIAARLWKKLDGKIYLHPPTNKKYRAFTVADIYCEPRAYLDRDRHIVESSHTLVACPQTYDEQLRSGTWTTVRYARKLRRRIYIIQPDGTVVEE